MKLGILGGGLSAVSTAYFLQDSDMFDSIELLEKDSTLGGLARSYMHDGVPFDVGPHIIFSKDKEILEFMIEVLGENQQRLRRSNKIFYKGRYVKYPFENDLSALPQDDRDYCLNAFLNNPYENYQAANMLQFFLKMFGEGITNCYLRPYNEKIWKFDPSYMDTQMVDRIPKPPAEDIIKSASGVSTEGYLHQLYFHYPKHGGTGAFFAALADRLSDKVIKTLNFEVARVERDGERWRVTAADGATRIFDRLITTIPVHTATQALGTAIEEDIAATVASLKYNSISICVVSAKQDTLGDNFAVMVPDKSFVFHRLSKLNFMGENYAGPNGETVLLVEVTFREGDLVSKMSDEELKARIVDDLDRIGFTKKDDVTNVSLKAFKYAYVIYDLGHRPNMDKVLSYYEDRLGILMTGRFGVFEYVNMDQVLRMSKNLADRILSGKVWRT